MRISITKYSNEENVTDEAKTFRMQMQQVTKKFVEEQFQDICGVEVIYDEDQMKKRKKLILKVWSKLLLK